MKPDLDRVCLGAVVGAHGIKGEVKVKSFTAADADIGAYGALEDEKQTRLFELRVTGHSKELLRCKIKGVDDRNAAEALIGTKLYANRAVLPELSDKNEFYLADLVGLKVLNAENHEVGKVCGMYNFGAGDILELKLESGKTEMLPFSKTYVPEVDVANGFVRVAQTSMNFVQDEEDDVKS